MPTPTHWILDWDSTITTHDTLSSLVRISASTPSRSPAQKHHILQEWTRVSNAYMDDLSLTLATHAKNVNDAAGAGPGDALDQEKEMLRVMEDVERRSLQRVANSRIFEGLRGGEVMEGARKEVLEGRVRVRKGFGEFCERWVSSSSTVSKGGKTGEEGEEVEEVDSEDHAGLTILSVNWSRHFIASCLAASQPPIKFPTESIISNELEGLISPPPATHPHTTANTDDEPTSTGNIISTYTHPNAPPLILSSRHKLAILESLLSSSAAEDTKPDPRTPTPPSRQNKKVIYIGDSPTDLECLLAADLGICMRDQDDKGDTGGGKLGEALARCGVACIRLRDVGEESGNGGRRFVAWVRDFDEVNAWVDGGV